MENKIANNESTEKGMQRLKRDLKRKEDRIKELKLSILGVENDSQQQKNKMSVLSDMSNVRHQDVKQIAPLIIEKQELKWDNLDEEDEGDPVMVSEYIEDIMNYMRSIEKKTGPDRNYITAQKEVTFEMRSILIDWLIEVQWKLKLHPETLFLTVNIVDRFLSLRGVSTDKLQLVGLSATIIAAKYEEIIIPSISNFSMLSENAYTSEEILKAERYMLHVLDYFIGMPSPMTFLRRVSKADDYDVRTRTIAKYLMETSLLASEFIGVPGSLIATSAIYIGRIMLKSGQWNVNLCHYSGYEEEDLMECVELFKIVFTKEIKYDSVYKKYSAKKFMRVSPFVKDYYSRQNVQKIITNNK
eukprot:GHVP01058160.1.p1 GENE.GHVP01058160.1~~GHVP01058160.1.p1  ORF type:complete len:357 (+),score=61.74 GHVP01058160.1:457-1527(+)